MTSASPGRPGPRVDLDVRAALLDTAERLFAKEGVGSISLRAIGRDAGVSPTAVGYHFATKQALVAAVVRRRSIAARKELSVRLRAVTTAGKGTVTARDVVDAVVDPMVRVINTDPGGGFHWFKLLTQLAQVNDPIWLEEVTREPDLRGMLWSATTRALPDADPAVLQVRLAIALHGILMTLAFADRALVVPRVGEAGLDPAFVDQLARFTAAGIAAP